MTLEQFKKIAKKMPDTPGAYFFLGKNKEVLYIGKATSLRDRVRSYFAKDLATTRGPLIVSMLEKARSVDWRQTDSVLEALILEANLIKNYKPKHNTDLKDDKSWNYVVITREDFPRVLLVRGKELGQLEEGFAGKARRTALRAARPSPTVLRALPAPLHTFGPFPHGLQLREALKLIRKIFPYRDTCTPCEALQRPPKLYAKDGAKQGKSCKPCFNAHIRLCPGVCVGDISKQEYRKIIRNISLLFQGKKETLLAMLKREMKQAAKKEEFEKAARLRRQVFALEHIRDISLIKDEYKSPSTSFDFAQDKSPGAIRSERIEAYDMAHLRGSANVGVMTVVEDGEPSKGEYRKFRIRTAGAGDDVGALREVLTRRLGHDEWPLPRIIAVDGAKAQINAAEGILKTYGMQIPVVGVVKDEKHRPRDIRGNRDIIRGRERDILLANAEAHRFAIGYHRKRSRQEQGIL